MQMYVRDLKEKCRRLKENITMFSPFFFKSTYLFWTRPEVITFISVFEIWRVSVVHYRDKVFVATVGATGNALSINYSAIFFIRGKKLIK